MKKIIAAVAVLLSCVSFFAVPVHALNCDQEAAKRILSEMQSGLGFRFDDHGVNLFVDIDSIWNQQNLDRKNQLLRAIADADACVQGKARGIIVYAWGEKVAEASPTWGFKVIK